MAHIFLGDSNRVDREVLTALEQLPNDFWIFGEFTLERNVDWFICRAVSPYDPTRLSTLILTELKRISRSLRGDVNTVWEMLDDQGVWQEIRPSNERDTNPYFQAINTANSLAEWLWNNQRRYSPGSPERPIGDFKLWPDLLILSPIGTRHQLPIAPSSRYGRWFFQAEDWVNHLLEWAPKKGVRLTAEDLSHLADVLGLTPYGQTQPEPEAISSTPSTPVVDFAAWLNGLEARLSRLEQLIGDTAQVAEPPARAATAVVANRTNAWSAEERAALISALNDLRRLSKSRALPGVLEAMNQHLGYRLQDHSYNGFGNARVMFERARSEGIVRFGPLSGPNPTIFLPDEGASPT